MPRLSDLSSGEATPLNLKVKKNRLGDFYKKLRIWWHKKDLSGITRFLPLRAWFYNFRSLIRYLFKKLQNSYRTDQYLASSLSGTLPPALRSSKLDIKTRQSLRLTGLLGLLGIFLVLFLLANLGILFVNSASLKDTVLDQIQLGYQSLENGYQQVLDFKLNAAAEDFRKASKSFGLARSEVTQINRGVNLLPFSPLSTGASLLQAGENLSEAGNNLALAAETLLKTQNINEALDYFISATSNLRVAQQSLQRVDLGLIPKHYQEDLEEAATLLEKIMKQVELYESWLPQIKELFGSKLPKRYLIAFLNSSEARPCGGFLGSFAIADFQDGALKKLDAHDTYSVDWQLWENFEAPVPLQPYMKTLHMRDSTFAPELKQCAENINYFYERALGGSSLNGVILINEQMLQDVLNLVGPIEMPEYNLTVTAENFFTLLQVEIETNKDAPMTPKQILLDLVPKVKDKIFKVDPGLFLKTLHAWIAKRDLQAYFFDSSAVELATHFKLATPFLETAVPHDFLFLSSFNVGGNKSDRYLNDQVVHRSNFQSDGSIEDVIIWKRTHSWSNQDQQQAYALSAKLKRLSYREQQRILYILGAGANQDVIQIYVPAGSTLTEWNGVRKIETINAGNYTIFYFTWEIQPGSSSNIILKYELPFQVSELDDNYRFEVLRQSGQNPFNFSKELDLGRDYLAEGSSWVKESALLADRFVLVKEFESD